MILDRLIGFLFRLLANLGLVGLGDDMDSLPYIADSPDDVITETVEQHDEDASNPARKGVPLK